MSSQEKEPQAAEVIDVSSTPRPIRGGNDARVEELNQRLRKLEETQSGENVRLISMFVLGISAGISLTLLYIEVIRKLL